MAQALGVAADAVKFIAAGINHLTWFTEVWVHGQDAMPRLRQIAAQRLAGGVLPKAGDPRMSPSPWDESGLNVDYPFAWQLLDCFPAVLDRHITEFFPHLFRGEKSYYGRTLGLDAFPFEAVIELGDAVYREMEQHALDRDPLPADYFDRIKACKPEAVYDRLAAAVKKFLPFARASHLAMQINRRAADGAWIVGLYNPWGAVRGDVMNVGSVFDDGCTMTDVLRAKFTMRSVRLLHAWPGNSAVSWKGDEIHVVVGPGGTLILEVK